MRGGARTSGKSVPTIEQLTAFKDGLLGMGCPHCKREMHWDRSHGTASQITLQHYRDGTMGFLCHSCNARHAAQDGDSFVAIPITHKLCRDCNQVKPLEAFALNRNHQRFDDRHTYCKACFSERNRRYRLTGTTKKGAA